MGRVQMGGRRGHTPPRLAARRHMRPTVQGVLLRICSVVHPSSFTKSSSVRAARSARGGGVGQQGVGAASVGTAGGEV